MPEIIRNIADEQKFRFKRSLRLCLQKVLKRGVRCCTVTPDPNRRIEYSIKASSTQAMWKLYASDEGSEEKYRCAGTYTTLEMRAYFNKIGCYLEEHEWRDVGLGYKAEITQLAKRNS